MNAALSPTPTHNPYGGSLVLAPSQCGKLDELFKLLQQLSFTRGDFTLASGAKSDWYMDANTPSVSGELPIEHLHPVIRENNKRNLPQKSRSK